MPDSNNEVDLKRTRRRTLGHTLSVDRLPPHAEDVERVVIGCCIINASINIPICIERLSAGAEAFYDLRHKTLFEVLLEMWNEKQAIDPTTIAQNLKDKNLLESIGGFAYFAALPDSVDSDLNLPFYADVIQEKYLLRQVVQTCTGVVGQVYDHQGSVDELMDDVEHRILKIRESTYQEHSHSTGELVSGAVQKIEALHAGKDLVDGIKTGFIDFDRMTSGLHPGEMIVIAARTSVGKTSMAMNIAEHVGVDLKLPVGVFSLEMTAESLMLRLLCSRSRVNIRNIKDGLLSDEDINKILKTEVAYSKAPIWIDDSSGLTIMQLRAKARRLWQQHGIKLLVIDYLQMLRSDSRKIDSRQQEVAEVSCGIKALAKELHIPIVVLAQLNREAERETRSPKLSDLRESGSIEQDSDVVCLLYKGKTNAEENDISDAQSLTLTIAKQRCGPTGDIELVFLKPYTRFESASRVFEPVPTQKEFDT